MSFNVTGLSDYTQKATEILREGIFSNDISEFELQTGIMYKEFLNFIDVNPSIVAGACGDTVAGNTVISERVIEVIPMMANQKYCLSDLDKKALTNIDVKKAITEDTAAKLGKTNTSVLFGGNALGLDGWIAQLAADTDTIDVVGATLSVANIEAEVAKTVAVIPEGLFARDILTLYVNYATFNLYKVARLATGLYRDQDTTFGVNEIWLNGYEGQIKIKAELGIPNNTMLLTWAKNLVIGTDELNEVSSLKWVFDEVTDFVHLKAKWKLGTSYKYATEAILYAV